jgi:predicted pyridoxine 5'-phosphate oxidase superfamily flavin-nucleotide-binding protein
MSDVTLYHDGSRQLQDSFQTRRLADRLQEVIAHQVFTDADRAFIESRPMFFLATADADGRPDCSYKGGRPGFVRVVGPGTLAFPSYDGNGMFKSLGNVLVNPHVGMLFIDFEQPNRVRVNGVATVDPDDPLGADMIGAMLVVRVRTAQVFPNCSRYIHKLQLVERSKFVPKPNIEAPIPDWKRMTWAQDYLPAHDPARAAEPLT